MKAMIAFRYLRYLYVYSSNGNNKIYLLALAKVDDYR